MTEAVDDADAGKRRRLPLWMARASCSDEIRDHRAGDGLQDAGSEPRKPAQAVDHLDEFEATRRTVAGQRKRKASRRNVGRDGSSSSNGTGETKTTTEETEEGETTVDNAANNVKIGSRKSQKRSKNSGAACSLASTESEIELTVEDLVRIAEEVIIVISRMGCSMRRRPRLSGTGYSVRLRVAWSNCRPTRGDRSNVASCDTNSRVEDLPAAPPRTGDAAGDMLDLLLGPLLKKPSSEEHENRRTVATETMNLTRKTSASSTASKEIWKEEVLPSKRKSSLKDKVAMLLD
ncbi:unnamed protein product [Musa textilis]